MRDNEFIVAEDNGDQGRSHPDELHLAFGGTIDRRVDGGNLFHQASARERLPRPAVPGVGGHRLECGFKSGGQKFGRHAARHFTGAVTAHSVGQNRQTASGIGKDGIFVVPADQAWVGLEGDFERTG